MKSNRSGRAQQVFEPERQVEAGGGEVAGGDQAQDCFPKLGGQIGKSVAGAEAGDRVEFVETPWEVEAHAMEIFRKETGPRAFREIAA